MKTHPLHGVIARYRLVGNAAAVAILAATAASSEQSTRAFAEIAAVVLGYALALSFFASRVDPSVDGAMRTLFVDPIVLAWALERSGYSGPFSVFFVVAIAINLAAVTGLRPMLAGLGLLGLLSVGFHAVVSTPVQVTTGSTLAFGLLATALSMYVSLVGLQVFAATKRVIGAREEIRALAASLDGRVRERTAALAATNAAIQRFVPREFLHALGHDDVTTTKLGDATSKSITVLFADIRNFTSSSEGMTPEETFAFLNGCLSKLGPHVRAQSGFVDKYIGDAIMALFPREPGDAVRAAVAMQDEVRRSNELAPGRTPLAIGVGIHIGRVMMGTIGEEERFEATVISDAVNLTARLESLTKQLGCSVLISEEVYATLDADLRSHTRRLGTFVVKGKAQPVTLYEVFASDSEALRETKSRTRVRFDAMLEAFATERLEAALAIASELRDACPNDGPANWWFMRLVKESATGDEGVPSSRGIVRLDEK